MRILLVEDKTRMAQVLQVDGYHAGLFFTHLQKLADVANDWMVL